jgi:hypothetical protein
MATDGYTVDIKSKGEYWAFRKSDGVQTSYSVSNSTGRFARKSRTGNWDRKKPKVLTPTPYDLEHTVIRNPSGEIVAETGGTRRRWLGNMGSVSHPSGWEPGSVKLQLQNEALIDALTALKDQRFNAGVAIAEARGTANMAADIMNGISKVRRDFLKRDYRAAYNRFRRNFKSGQSWSEFKRIWGDSLQRSQRMSKIPNTWLYYHFGIKPTISDIDAIHQDWFRRHRDQTENWNSIVKGSAKYAVNRRGKGSGATPIPADIVLADIQSMRVFLTVRPQNAYLARLAQMGATNLPEAAWNAVPYSWMVDYFTSMGDWLSVLDAGLGYEFGATVQSYRRITRWSCKTWDISPGHGTGSVRITPYSYRKTVLDRDVIQELYPPMFRVRPMVKLGAPTTKRFANMLSVLAGLFSGRGTSQGRT